MPFVHIRICGSRLSHRQVETLQIEATALMAGVMHKKSELTAVLVEEPDTGRWSIGGSPSPLAAHLEVAVTAGTNTAEEKASFVEKAHALLKAVVGPELPIATYVVVNELSADAWGYGGQTQAARRTALS